MKGYLIEIRNNSDPETSLSAGAVVEDADENTRYRMAQIVLGRIHDTVKDDTGFFAVEYKADWTDCANPVMEEVNRYDITHSIKTGK